MFNLGPLELMAIFIVALLVFGPNKLPEIGRQVGRAVREFRKIQSSFQTEFRDVLEEPLPGPVIPKATPEPPASPVADGDGGGPPSAEDPTPDSQPR